MEMVMEIVGSLLKELSKSLSALDIILVIALLLSWYLMSVVASKMWEAYNTKLDKIQEANDARFAQVEKSNKENTHRITQSVDGQNEILNDVADNLGRLNNEIIRAVTILQERKP